MCEDTIVAPLGQIRRSGSPRRSLGRLIRRTVMICRNRRIVAVSVVCIFMCDFRSMPRVRFQQRRPRITLGKRQLFAGR